MRVHERTFMVDKAALDLQDVYYQWMKANPNLTYLEVIICTHRLLDSPLRYALRSERHPDDPEKKADEA